MAHATQTPGAGTEPRAPDSLTQRMAWQIRNLHPAYFALVMATGIISDAAFVLGHPFVSDCLLAVNLVAYPWLMIALVLRALHFPRQLWADLTNPKTVFAFFTIVAATNVFGVQLFLRGFHQVATVLWLFALAATILLGYFSFGVLAFANSRSRGDVIYGGWLVAIVGTESVVLLGIQLAPGLGEWAGLARIGIYVTWGIGVALYGIFVTLFSNRLFFERVRPEEMTPILWVVMGAAAITTNAGAALILSEPVLPFLAVLRPFVQGTTLVLWAWSTWWIPLLVLFGLWKYGKHRDRLAYHPTFWSVVFPLGMYSMATYRFSLMADFPLLIWIPRVMVWVAIAAWVVTMGGALRAAVKGLSPVGRVAD